MTPAERRDVSLRLLACAEKASRARDAHDWAEHRRWASEATRWRLILRYDLDPQLDPEKGPQGDAAL